MVTPTEEIITISVSDAHIIRAALNSAYHQNAVLDLAEQYRRLTQRPQASKLTHALSNALNILVEYIELGNPESEEPDESPQL